MSELKYYAIVYKGHVGTWEEITKDQFEKTLIAANNPKLSILLSGPAQLRVVTHNSCFAVFAPKLNNKKLKECHEQLYPKQF